MHSLQPVSWTIAPWISGGEIRVSLVAQDGTTWMSEFVPATAGQLSYECVDHGGRTDRHGYTVIVSCGRR